MRCIATLENNYQGSIILDEKKVKELNPQERARRIGMVFQAYNLFPHLTALYNCTLALTKTYGIDQKQASEKALKKLELLGIGHLAERYPHQLSGGQQQRVALARALALEPEILLLDEPTAALDPFNTANLQRIITDLKKSGITIIISTHDTEFVKGIFERSYLFDNGSVAEYIETRNNLTPTTKTAHFLGFSF
jgi:polar amino acid transport system ATP-binding protein